MHYFYYAMDPLLIAAAVIPAAALMLYVYRADRLERESAPLLWRLIFQGIISTSLAVYTERIGTHLLSSVVQNDTLIYRILFNFLVVGLSEEGFKYLLLKRRTWNAPDFNCKFDGVVYAVFVSLGFALWENIEYVVLYGFGTALVRAVTAVPGHACFGVFMGAWYGLAKAHENKGNQFYSALCRRMAVICPTLLHGLYDLIATMEGGGLSWLFLSFIALMFLAAYLTVRNLSRTDHYIR